VQQRPLNIYMQVLLVKTLTQSFDFCQNFDIHCTSPLKPTFKLDYNANLI